MSKYTIIGGNGFIGSHIVTLLKEQGHNVVVPDRNSCNSLNGELGKIILLVMVIVRKAISLCWKQIQFCWQSY